MISVFGTAVPGDRPQQGGTTYSYDTQSGGTDYSAMDSPGRPLLREDRPRRDISTPYVGMALEKMAAALNVYKMICSTVCS